MDTKFMKSNLDKKKNQQPDPHIPPIAGMLFGVLLIIAVLGVFIGDGKYSDAALGAWVLFWTAIGIYILFALKVANQWEKAVVLRLGKFHGLKGPGMFWIIPIVDSATSWIDHRVIVTSFSAEKTLTKDTVPVDVDAVLFWVVWDAEKAALERARKQRSNPHPASGSTTPMRALRTRAEIQSSSLPRSQMTGTTDLQAVAAGETNPFQRRLGQPIPRRGSRRCRMPFCSTNCVAASHRKSP